MSDTNVAVVGLSVMGSNLARNIESRGIPVAVFNRTGSVTDEFMSSFGTAAFTATKSLEELVATLARPRQIILMVKAGKPVDLVLESLLPLLETDDIVVDGGNSYFKDTIRRERQCADRGVHFLGVGVSGGEEGALNGPSIMPGGEQAAWQVIAPMLDQIAAQADGPCTAYMGPDGAGHFVKMVHNGIEYGDMQLIAEAYDLLRTVAKASPAELGEVFHRWNSGPLESYLIEITADIFKKKDEQDYLINVIMDRAGQKGTGRWTAQEALDLGVAVPTISAAVDARILSSYRDERLKAAEQLPAPVAQDYDGDHEELIEKIHDALYGAKIISYAQGMAMLSAASREYSWNLQLNEVARIWKGGCIIRARFLGEIQSAFSESPELQNLMLARGLSEQLITTMPQLRKVVRLAAQHGVAVPAFSASLSYFDSYRRRSLPQNLTQAQRDYFGAHTYERIDKDGSFHTDW